MNRLTDARNKAEQTERQENIDGLFPLEGDDWRLSMVTRTLPQHVLPMAVLEVIHYAQEAVKKDEFEYFARVQKDEEILHQKIGDLITGMPIIIPEDDTPEEIANKLNIRDEILSRIETIWADSVERLQRSESDFLDPETLTEEQLAEYDAELAEMMERGTTNLGMNLLKAFISAFDRRQISRNGEGRSEYLEIIGKRNDSDKDDNSALQRLRIGDETFS